MPNLTPNPNPPLPPGVILPPGWTWSGGQLHPPGGPSYPPPPATGGGSPVSAEQVDRRRAEEQRNREMRERRAEATSGLAPGSREYDEAVRYGMYRNPTRLQQTGDRTLDRFLQALAQYEQDQRTLADHARDPRYNQAQLGQTLLDMSNLSGQIARQSGNEATFAIDPSRSLSPDQIAAMRQWAGKASGSLANNRSDLAAYNAWVQGGRQGPEPTYLSPHTAGIPGYGLTPSGYPTTPTSTPAAPSGSGGSAWQQWLSSQPGGWAGMNRSSASLAPTTSASGAPMVAPVPPKPTPAPASPVGPQVGPARLPALPKVNTPAFAQETALPGPSGVTTASRGRIGPAQVGSVVPGAPAATQPPRIPGRTVGDNGRLGQNTPTTPVAGGPATPPPAAGGPPPSVAQGWGFTTGRDFWGNPISPYTPRRR